MQADLQRLLEGEVARHQKRQAEGYEPRAWILPEPSCELVAQIGALLGPQAVAFEFGSGASTAALRQTFASVTTVEDSAEWLDKTERLPGVTPKRAEDKTRVVPLTRCHLGVIPYHSFDLDRRIELLQRLESADFILIDSPTNPATREHVLYTALQHAKPGALILLDDTGEVRAARRFAQRLARDNAAMFDLMEIPIDHGLALFQKKSMGHVGHHPSLREMVGAWLRRVASFYKNCRRRDAVGSRRPPGDGRQRGCASAFRPLPGGQRLPAEAERRDYNAITVFLRYLAVTARLIRRAGGR